MIDQDDARIVYDDRRYFTRGRSAYHIDPNKAEAHLGWWVAGAVAVIVAISVLVHVLLPAIN